MIRDLDVVRIIAAIPPQRVTPYRDNDPVPTPPIGTLMTVVAIWGNGQMEIDGENAEVDADGQWTGRGWYATVHPQEIERIDRQMIRDLDVVRTLVPIPAERVIVVHGGHEGVAAGSVGTVLHVFDRAYQMEITDKRDVSRAWLVTVLADEVTLVARCDAGLV